MTDTGFSLRRATARDAPVMWALRADAIRKTCKGHYPAEMLERWASSPIPDTFARNIENEYFIVGVADSRIAGFAALRTSTAEVEAVFVAPACGRHGLGRRLLARLEVAAMEKGLQKLGLNASLNAVPFYRSAGYDVISEGTYTTRAGVEIACVRMEKSLDHVST
ncbi:MAG: GNAT family N-acetyltransferase [Rhodanobacteraceae bacterium]